MILFSCKIYGRVGIKKNNKQIIKRGHRYIPVSSKRFKEWETVATHYVNEAKSIQKPDLISNYCSAVYIFNFENRKNEIDTSNGVEGIADILEDTGVIVNDKLIKNFYATKTFGKEDSVEVYLFEHRQLLLSEIENITKTGLRDD